jgi:hypothetical protein
MKKKVLALTIALTLLFATAIPAFAAGPDFTPHIYADGAAWGTKGTTDLPAPNSHNEQSFDGLYAFTNGVTGQLPVAEAAPGNPAYNGGRWIAFNVTWNVSPVLVTSYDDLMDLEEAGDVTITPAPEDGRYFQCPLLPVK